MSDPTRPDDDWRPASVPPGLVDNLRSALRQQGDGVEPSHDAYRQLAEAVQGAGRPTAVTWLRPALAAAAAVAVLGAGVTLLTRSGNQIVGTGPAGDQVALDGDPADGQTAEATVPAGETAGEGLGAGGDRDDGQGAGATGEADEAEADDGDDGGEDAGGAGDLVGPVRASRLAAGQAFLDLLRLPFGEPELAGDRLVVRSRSPAGDGQPGPIVAELSTVAVDGGHAVTGARSAGVSIVEVSQGELAGGRLTIEGLGLGFEGVLDVRVVSGLDNRELARSAVTAGSVGEPVPFVTSLPVVGAERAWVVVSSAGGADGVIEPFAAAPVRYRAGADPADYAVVRVPADDPDGGLRLRAGPGADTPTLAVIPSGLDGVRRTLEYPVPNGTEAWWSVVAPDGQQGWVNSRFLAATTPLGAGQLDDLVGDVTARLAGGGGSLDVAALPLTRRADVAIGTVTEPVGVAPSSLLTPGGWTATRSVTPAGDSGQPTEVDLLTLYGVDRWPAATVIAGPAGFGGDAAAEVAERYFGGLPSITVVHPSPDLRAAGPRTHLFVEATPVGPEIVGILAEVASG